MLLPAESASQPPRPQRHALASESLGVAAHGTAFIAALEFLAHAAPPLAAATMANGAAWLVALALGGLVAFARGPARRALRRRVRPALVLQATERALRDLRGASDAAADATMWRVHLSERVLLVSGPSVVGSLGATVLALALLARGLGLRVVFAATGVVAAMLLTRALLARRLDPSLERLAAARARVGVRIAAAARDAGEIRAPEARTAFLRATSEAARDWDQAESAAEVSARFQRAALLGLALAGAAISWAWTANAPLRELATLGTSGLDAPGVRVLALALASLAPAVALLRGYDELAVDREQLRVAARELPADAPVEATGLARPATTLRARGLRVAYQDHAALDGVDLDASLAGVTAIAGPNGAGKSTLARVVAGVLPPSAGTLEIDGIPSTSVEASGIALVPQHPLLVESWTVGDNVRLVCPAVGDADARAMLTALGLDVDLGHPCGALSRGEQRRIAIARAILADPAVLVLDEPDAWLDANGREKLVAVLRRESTRRAVVLASHRADLLQWVDRVVLLGSDHTLEGIGTPRDLAARSPAFAALIAGAADEALAVGAERGQR